MDLIELLILIVKMLVVFTVFLTMVAYSTFGERRIAARMQNRIGPNRAGPFGILQPVADGVKFFFKEDMIPDNVNKWLFVLAPALAIIPPITTVSLIPFGESFEIMGRVISLQLANVNAGVIAFFAISSLGVYGFILAGWSSNNKYSLMGGLRSTSQMISYEITLGLAVLGVLMIAGSASFQDIVRDQSGFGWNVLRQPLGFLLFFIAALAEIARVPFDLPECEAELIGGYHTEYGSMKFGTLQLAEYSHMVVTSALLSTLYMGGWNFPFQEALGLEGIWLGLLQMLTLIIKMCGFILLFMWIRWTIPRFRFDQLMGLGWKVMLPLSVLNIVITGFWLAVLR